MEVKCAVHFPGGPESALSEAKAFFAERGWRDEGGSFTVSREAEPGGVDGPSIELHAKIRALYLPEGDTVHAVPVTFRITAGGRVMFCEPAAFGFAGGMWGIRISATDPPRFDDLLRLRDKIIATLTAIRRGE